MYRMQINLTLQPRNKLINIQDTYDMDYGVVNKNNLDLKRVRIIFDSRRITFASLASNIYE